LSKQIPFTLGLEPRVILAGLVSSAARATIETPFEYAKVKGQTGQIWHFKDAYTGYGANLMKCSGMLTSYFIMVDIIRRNTTAFDRKSTQFITSGA